MDGEHKASEETEQSRENPRPDPDRINAFEGLYEPFRFVPVKYIDLLIWVCVAVLIAVIAVGVLKGRGLI